jgi:hypothetical protein
MYTARLAITSFSLTFDFLLCVHSYGVGGILRVLDHIFDDVEIDQMFGAII